EYDEDHGLNYHPFDRAFFAGSMLFAACGGDRGCGLWSTNGAEAGTRLVVSSSGLGGSPAHFAATDRVVFFVAGPARPPALWTTDGRAAGTRRLAALPGEPRAMTAAGDRVFFLATGTDGEELWASDGTPAGTRALTRLAPSQPFTFDTEDPPV